MDYRKETIDLIVEFHKYKNDLNISKFLKHSCDYFDLMKDKELTQSEIQFLYYISNQVGVPQYFDLLNDNFNDGKLHTKIDNMLDLGCAINTSSLTINGGKKLHKFQKEILELFSKLNTNRYILSAPTSFGKTFLVNQIIEKMNYQNIILIFPTISLLSENYTKIIMSDTISQAYKIHTLSDAKDFGEKNIMIYTPERFLSFLDLNKEFTFDFIFIDEVYKIDNEYIIDEETKGENDRDVSYRIALEYACRHSKDILLAGPYMEISEKENNSFSNFAFDRGFEVVNYNDFEIVNRVITKIKGKSKYVVDGVEFELDKKNNYTKICSIINAFNGKNNNTIIYFNSPSKVEKCAREIILKKDNVNNLTNCSEIFTAFVEHLELNFGTEWVVTESIKLGVGVHHGLIPKYIQKQIIDFFNSGILSVLICTTTITEGVNTNAKNVIIGSSKKGNKCLRHFDAKNIAGRAGRFSHHFKGRVFVLDDEFEEIYVEKEDLLKHKNFDIETLKTEVDYLITDDKYLGEKERDDLKKIHLEIEKRQISNDIIEQYKNVDIKDKIFVYDEIVKMSDKEKEEIVQLIRKLDIYKNITWSGFQIVLEIIQPIVKNSTLNDLIKYKCKNDEGNSVLTAKVYYYLSEGYFGLLKNTREKNKNIDSAIRETSKMVYNILKYQLVKYLGVFDLMYRCYISKQTNESFNDVHGIATLLRKLEYSVLSEKARILSDFGVPFNILEYYEKDNLLLKKNFDSYEKIVDEKIAKLIK